MSELKEKILKRFLRYVSFDTQSDPASETYPSTAKQLLLLNHLLEEMHFLGLEDVEIDGHGYVTGTIPASVTRDGSDQIPAIGFLAHVDTSPDMNGAAVNPQIIQNYNGNDIPLGDSGLTLSPAEFPELEALKGHTVITTDGTTLLGSDDKAGVAEIMTLAECLMSARGKIEYGPIRIGFTPDEEVGRGVDFFDVERFGADFAYTVDGGELGELEYENFNAASAVWTIRGRNIHPGSAKGKMINAIQLAMELNGMLPAAERPEHTEGYEGFYHPVSIRGEVEKATLEYIIRDHSKGHFEARKKRMEEITEEINARYGTGVVTLTLKDQYYNMREKIEERFEGVELARQAMEELGIKPLIRPIRGGTDGARLSFMGVPCPNLFTGGANFHGRYEYVSLDVMELSVKTLIRLAELWAKTH